jgi:hypothetical protein
MKWARFRGLDSSTAGGWDWLGDGRNLVMREKMDGWAGGGFFKMDFPGIGIVTAEDDGEHDDDIGYNTIIISFSGNGGVKSVHMASRFFDPCPSIKKRIILRYLFYLMSVVASATRVLMDLGVFAPAFNKHPCNLCNDPRGDSIDLHSIV